MMQTLICSVILLLSVGYVLNRWLPDALKARLGLRAAHSSAASGCGTCSSCSGCGTSRGKGTTGTELAKKIFIVQSK